VQPELQRFVAKRMGATTTEVASSHVPMLSHPDLVINVIRAAAKRFKEPRRQRKVPRGFCNGASSLSSCSVGL
jgi:hypothetical protein